MPLRLCVWNVHSWRDRSGRTRVDDVIDVLRAADCDLVLLNEAPRGTVLSRVADTLAMNVAEAGALWAGNAVLARVPFIAAHKVPLQSRFGELRSAVVIDVDVGGAVGLPGGAPLRVVCTHLDHQREQCRLEQLAALQAWLGDSADLIGGDFNALRLADYPADERAHIERRRAAAQIEPAADDVVDRLEALGFVDAARASPEPDADDADGADGELPARLRTTCWAGTRVDYLWLGPRFARRVRVRRIEVLDVDVSDHRPVVVTLDAHG